MWSTRAYAALGPREEMENEEKLLPILSEATWAVDARPNCLGIYPCLRDRVGRLTARDLTLLIEESFLPELHSKVNLETLANIWLFSYEQTGCGYWQLRVWNTNLKYFKTHSFLLLVEETNVNAWLCVFHWGAKSQLSDYCQNHNQSTTEGLEIRHFSTVSANMASLSASDSKILDSARLTEYRHTHIGECDGEKKGE